MASDKKSQRIYAIDVLRGITVAAMIVVNNAGGKLSYAPLQHSEWNGMTLCDMVFPSFLFIVGLTAYISLSKLNFTLTTPLFKKIVRRTIIILLIGWALHAIEMVCKGHGLAVANLRLTGVLPRIALCYFAVSMIAVTCRKKSLYAIILLLTVVYSIILLCGHGFENDLNNLLSRVDRAVLGESHLYTKRPIDPEGLVGTIGALAHTLVGFTFGSLLLDRNKDTKDKLLNVMVAGFVLLLVGYALATVMPLNKRVWSPSFMLASCGLVAMALAAVSYVADLHGHRKLFRVFDIFGVNPLFLYVLSEVVAIIMSATGGKHVLYDILVKIIPDPYLASAVYSLLFVAVMWLAGYPLFKRKIYIKI